ncbi:hypothetical protein OIB37_31130 [Streptomyces sp. NBC_00820]|uniref:hypothetical protein n=1 Tax=Streptomyces sp. NBC_00820 TaxID=2975842 RepID=UPI002ED2B247|nr:hypothetical protein OIB37_31130 [Streptomyces sp. NBC_00820]
MSLDEVVAVLQDLNEFVVARRLAHARRVISVALDAQLSEEDNAEIDSLCDQGRFYGAESAISPSPDQPG